ncbi:MAG: hypothetical protein V4638_00790 [Bacteroidota bacterium]
MSDENAKSNSKRKIKASTESLIRKEITDRLEKGTRRDSNELTEQAKSDIEKRIVLNFAKEKGLWIENLYDLGHPIKGGGNENTLALDNIIETK